ncbi:reverse transcriptase, partial [Tanacetum coccineum]
WRGGASGMGGESAGSMRVQAGGGWRRRAGGGKEGSRGKGRRSMEGGTEKKKGKKEEGKRERREGCGKGVGGKERGGKGRRRRGEEKGKMKKGGKGGKREEKGGVKIMRNTAKKEKINGWGDGIKSSRVRKGLFAAGSGCWTMDGEDLSLDSEVDIGSPLKLFRDSNGSLCYAHGDLSCAEFALYAEIIAIRFACLFASNHGWLNAIVESDSQMAISLSSLEAHPLWRFATLIDDIRLWAKNMHITFSWVKREQNKVAHWVASHTISYHFTI